jgi:hypothetical protein
MGRDFMATTSMADVATLEELYGELSTMDMTAGWVARAKARSSIASRRRRSSRPTGAMPSARRRSTRPEG